MSENRRAFLKCLGALGAIGAVLPTDALAFGRRRARVVYCPPVCEPGPVQIRPVPYTSVPGFHVSFPNPAGADPASATEIRGKGGFATWGSYNLNATPAIMGVQQAWAYSETGVLLATGSLMLMVPSPNRWGFNFANLPLNTPFEIRYRILRNSGGFFPEGVDHPYAWFKCVNDHPF